MAIRVAIFTVMGISAIVYALPPCFRSINNGSCFPSVAFIYTVTQARAVQFDILLASSKLGNSTRRRCVY